MNQTRTAALLTLLLVGFYGWFLVGGLENPGLYHYDEFLTLERSQSIVESGDLFAIYWRGSPDMKKPPLQYLMGASLLALGLEPTVALRSSSVVFGLGSLLLLASLTSLLAPEHPWAKVTAVLLFCSSSIFAVHARVALLDAGLVFFLLLSLWALFKAEQDSRWWVMWGIACGLGTLQKAPVALFVSVLLFILTKRQQIRNELSTLWGDLWFRAGSLVMLVLCSFWPIVQTLRFGPLYRRVYLSGLLFRGTTGVDQNHGKGFRLDFDWLTWMRDDSFALWLVVLGVSLWAASQKAPRQNRVWMFWVPTLIWLALLTVSGGPVYARYILAFSPLMAVFTAVLLSELSPRAYLPPALALVVLLVNGQALGSVAYEGTRKNRFPLVLVCQRLPELLESSERAVFFAPPSSVVAASVPPEVAYIQLRSDESPQDLGSYLGIAHKDLFSQQADKWTKATTLVELEELVLFRFEQEGPEGKTQ